MPNDYGVANISRKRAKENMHSFATHFTEHFSFAFLYPSGVGIILLRLSYLLLRLSRVIISCKL